ncbi:fam-a protein [Plasmodium yoelii]|uniref:Fam-a protein n=3 Tax=Plasmodium yoelii TaxID=5861 RepID=A0AAF0B263_PLAYO|nr:fam-a protein [Plasmodium yoelii]WBY59682.1 fam-a protein [Plasmodium yoelii yoelii]CDU19663.1 fam-a protein [Plasmodium yoelii]VTZ80420.1 fam-a protein [Plasmodium yoelii]|eukprot:XP_022813477.1 fam-a protein [Plasmodium yoelii]
MNKGYIKTVFFLLSLFVYVTNKALASERFPRETSTGRFTSRTIVRRRVVTSSPSSNIAGPSNASSNVAGPSNARSNVAGPSNASSNIAGPSNASSNVTGPSNVSSNVAGPSNASSGSYESDELYENHKHLLCTNREEIKNAEKVMKDAMPLLIHHATNGNSCDKSCQSKNNGKLNMAKHGGDTYIGKMNHKFPNPNMYTDLITMLWNPYCPNKLDKTLNNGKVVRVYTPNLIMVQYRYKNNNESFQRYFYALAAKYKVSEDTAVIVMSSANINDHNHTEQKNYTNLILESANSFETEVDSEPDIRRGELKKMFVNLSGYLIKKEHNYVDITYIRSIDGNVPNDKSLPTKTLRS